MHEKSYFPILPPRHEKLTRSSIMQNIVDVICKKLHETIVLIQKYQTEVNRNQKKLQERLEALEDKRLTNQSPEDKSNSKSHRYRMKSQQITRIRLHLNLSQADFARLIGVDRACINRWEHGKIIPSNKTAAKIAKFRRMGKKALAAEFQRLEREMWEN